MIDVEEIVLKYIPSEELVADLLTKAITGAKFKCLRTELLGEPSEARAYGFNERARAPMRRSFGKLGS